MNPVKKIETEKLFAVIRINDASKIKPMLNAIYEGGIKTAEIVIENPETALVIEEITKTKDRPMIMAGGIITQRQAQIAIQTGADAIVSPIFQMNLMRFCKGRRTPLIMTASTPNEAYSAWMAGTEMIKISPAAPMGGAEYIEDILRPMKFLNIMAAGSIALDDIPAYLKAGAKAIGIGRALYKDADYAEITRRAQKAARKVQEAV